MRPATPAKIQQECAYGASTLCDGQKILVGPSRGYLCPCMQDRCEELLADELVTLPPVDMPHIEIKGASIDAG